MVDLLLMESNRIIIELIQPSFAGLENTGMEWVALFSVQLLSLMYACKYVAKLTF